jgi:hypothetical protein
MRKLTAIVLVLVSAFGLAADVQRVEHEFQGIRLGGLLRTERAMGCSCNFRYIPGANSPDVALLEWGLGREGNPESASMYVDGMIEKLKLTQDFAFPVRPGDPVSCKLTGPRVQVELSLTTMSVCDGTRECDGMGFTGTMRVIRSATHATIPVSGGCGC